MPSPPPTASSPRGGAPTPRRASAATPRASTTTPPALNSPVAARSHPPAADKLPASSVRMDPAALAAVFQPESAMEAVCEANGIKSEDFLSGKASATVEEIELFLMVFPAMPNELSFFPRLTTLKLMHVCLEVMPDFTPVAKTLQRVWLSENEITSLSPGIPSAQAGGMPRLTELYANSNRLETLDGVERCPRLRVLWIQDNRLAAIEDRHVLPCSSTLESVYAAKNELRSVEALRRCRRLTTLNLGGNRIASFRDVLPLAALPALRELYFDDPTYGSNLICRMCNYVTFTVYNLQRLDVLDHQPISPDQRAVAESTFAKKKIYYSMRVRTLKRNARSLIAAARRFRETKGETIAAAVLALRKHAAVVRAEAEVFDSLPLVPGGRIAGAMAASSEAGGSADGGDADQKNRRRRRELFEAKADRAAAISKGRLEALDTMDRYLRAAERHIVRATNVSVSKLLLELQTGGNVRVEDGRPGDEWHEHCVGLLRTRLSPFAGDFAKYGVKDLKVSKVMQVHNRTLRSRFQSTLETVVDTSDGTYRRAIEYLFLVEYPPLPDSSLFRLMELGPQPPGAGRGIPLTNSAFVAEQCRLQALRRAEDPHAPVAGRVIVCKVFLGKSVAEMTPFAARVEESEGLAGGPPVLASHYPPGTCSVYRGRPADAKQRVWFVMHPELVLPEFIVEFTYSAEQKRDLAASGSEATGGAGSPRPAFQDPPRKEDVNEVIARLFPKASPADAADLRYLGTHFTAFAGAAGATAAAPGNGAATVLLAASPAPPKRHLRVEAETGRVPDAAALYEFMFCPQFGDAAAKSPTDPAGSITANRASAAASPDPALAAAGASDSMASDAAPLLPPPSETRSRLAGLSDVRIVGVAALRSLDGLAALLPALVRLDVPYCGLAGIDLRPAAGETLTSLRRLDVTGNAVTSFAGLAACPKLTTFLAGGNAVSKVEGAHMLASHCRGLATLALDGNPVCAERGFLDSMVSRLPDLTEFDGADVAAWRQHLKAVPGDLATTDLAAAIRAANKAATAGVMASRPASPAASARGAMSASARLSVSGRTGAGAGGPGAQAAAAPPSVHDRIQILERPMEMLTPSPVTAVVAAQDAADMHAELVDSDVVRPAMPQGSDLEAIEQATALSLRGRRLRSLGGLAAAANGALIQLDLGDNELASTVELPALPHLQSLTADGNAIFRLDGIGKLAGLCRLELARNRISALEPVAGLRSLSFLGIEDNRVESLAPLADMPVLAELYAGGNRLQTSKDVMPVRTLPKLIIADFSGNPCAGEEKYRLYLVFQLKRLKVLDGAGIDGAEQAAAKDMFAGRVSAELIGERVLSGADWSHVCELSLTGCALRDVAMIEELPSLRHLALDRNVLSDISGLTRAPKSLRTLNLGFNRLHMQLNAVGASLRALDGLESLSLEGNSIQSIAAMQLRLPRLKFLNMKSNELQRVDGLDGLPLVRELVLDKNKIRALERDCFVPAQQITSLSVCENALKTIEGVRALPRLQIALFNVNRIGEVMDIERAFSNGGPADSIREISFLSNPVQRKNMYRLSAVFIFRNAPSVDGREVLAEERQRAEQYFNPEAAAAAAAGQLGGASVAMGAAAAAGAAGNGVLAGGAFGGFQPLQMAGSAAPLGAHQVAAAQAMGGPGQAAGGAVRVVTLGEADGRGRQGPQVRGALGVGGVSARAPSAEASVRGTRGGAVGGSRLGGGAAAGRFGGASIRQPLRK